MAHLVNPLRIDMPDLDAIRVGDTYYMVSTTNQNMPGGAILKSYDLAHWEICRYIYDRLGESDGQNLKDGKHTYGGGMWAATIRYHKEKYYIAFVANDTHETYLYTTDDLESGVFEKKVIKGFYHDSSILFDDDGRVYIMYGNANIRITELDSELNGPLEGGFDKVVIRDDPSKYGLKFEGSHLYKLFGRYYAFFIHWRIGGRRIEACWSADSIEGPWTGEDIFDIPADGRGDGIAQGGIIDTPDGKYYMILFQDHGAVGRIPYVIPMEWVDGKPVLDTENFMEYDVPDGKPYDYKPFIANDDFAYEPDKDGKIALSDVWQFNHNPDNDFWTVKDGKFCVTTRDIVTCPLLAVNSLAQHTMGQVCDSSCVLDYSDMENGDIAGLYAFEGVYGGIGIAKENGEYFVTVIAREQTKINDQKFTENYKYVLEDKTSLGTCSGEISLRILFDFAGRYYDKTKDTAYFFYKKNDSDEWVKIGNPLFMPYTTDVFVGVRPAFITMATEKTGGTAKYGKFRISCED